jgi:creatinine amidohydrolase/Fe(II)-dependent formamide hydrolase-like protein
MRKAVFGLVAALSLVTIVAADQQPGQAGAAGAQQGQRQRREPDPRTMGGGDCRDNPYNCKDTPNPLPAATTVWIEEMTWMDVRDALAAGKTTAIISTGGIEPNGPWLVTGKHNYVLRANCEATARKLGNALCAPILEFVPEGTIEPPSGHMTSPGTISLREETFQAVLTDIASSLKQHGFKNIAFIGDSGGNQRGQQTVANALTQKWAGSALAVHIPQYYDYNSVAKHLASKGLVTEGKSDGLHDDPVITMNMFITDPNSVRYDARVKAGKASINGFSLADRKKTTEIAKEIVEFRATVTANAIKAAIAGGGKTTSQQ